ncbi:MAG TPA: efflux RND transporter permease subunit, partial [Nitrosomonas sp.]|nr:efflux RND transporter permease subunit [Nitrosomonas sp.]
MSLSSISISRPVTIIMFFIGITILGIIAFQNLAVDFLPPVKIPKLTIQTSYPNTSPDEVEKRLTQHIETAINTVTGVKKVSSISREGLSIVTAEFYWSTNMDFALLDVREKLDQLRALLPQEANRSTILKVDPSTEPIMTIAVSPEKRRSSILSTQSLGLENSYLMDLKGTAQALLKRRIEQIEGVAQVSVLGGVDREIQVELNMEKLQGLGITLDQVSQALANANVNLPGGTIKKGLFRYSLRSVGEFTNIDQLRDVIVSNTETGRSIRVSDIGRVVDTLRERMGLTTYNGDEIVTLEVRKEAGTNTVATSKKVKDVLNQLQSEYPGFKLTILADQAEYINESINDVLQAIIIGAVLAFLVLFFFLRNPKYPIIIGLTTPISILGTFIVMYFLHITLNIISLTGLALGIGMLGDNA